MHKKVALTRQFQNNSPIPRINPFRKQYQLNFAIDHQASNNSIQNIPEEMSLTYRLQYFVKIVTEA